MKYSPDAPIKISNANGHKYTAFKHCFSITAVALVSGYRSSISSEAQTKRSKGDSSSRSREVLARTQEDHIAYRPIYISEFEALNTTQTMRRWLDLAMVLLREET